MKRDAALAGPVARRSAPRAPRSALDTVCCPQCGEPIETFSPEEWTWSCACGAEGEWRWELSLAAQARDAERGARGAE